MNISVCDNLRKRMIPWDNRTNWSKIARQAFQEAVCRLEITDCKGESLEAEARALIVARFKRSRRHDHREAGRQAGRLWAGVKATEDELERMKRGHRNGTTDLNFLFVGDLPAEMGDPKSPDYCIGFVEGALALWAEVETEVRT